MRDAETSAVRELLLDAFGRVRGLVEQVTRDLSPEAATFRPDPEANTIAWLVWHLARIQDDHIADVAGVEQAWHSMGWQKKFALPFDAAATGFAHTASDVAEVTVSPSLIAAYHADVHALTTRFLEDLDLSSLDRIIDERWDPPVTMSVRIVSVVSDCLQHVGQAAYLRGLAERHLGTRA